MVDGCFVKGGCVFGSVEDEIEDAGGEACVTEDRGEEVVRFGAYIGALSLSLFSIH